MALYFNSIDYNENDFQKRLDPKYYQMQEILKNFTGTKKVSICPFGDVINKITDGEHAGQTFVREGVLFLKNSSVKDFDISLNDGFYISKEDHERLSRSAIYPGDILFTTIGHLGSAAIVPEKFVEANMNQNFVKITIDSNKIDAYYLTCFLNSKFARRQVSSLLTGNIQSILTYPKIKNIKVLYPNDINIQINIANKYKKALELSQLADQLIKEAVTILENSLNIPLNLCEDLQIFSVASDDFYKNDNMWTVNFHMPEYINTEEQIKKHFKWLPLGRVSEITKGDEPGSEAYSDYLEKDDSDVPFIRTSDLYNYQVDLSPDNFIDSLTYDLLKQDIKPGDVLFTKDGKIGLVAMVTPSDLAVYQSGISRIRVNEYGISQGINQEYLFACLISKAIGQYSAKRYTVVASTIPHMKEKYIKQIVIPIIENEKILAISKKIREAFIMIDEKKQLLKQCQDLVDDITFSCFS